MTRLCAARSRQQHDVHAENRGQTITFGNSATILPTIAHRDLGRWIAAPSLLEAGRPGRDGPALDVGRDGVGEILRAATETIEALGLEAGHHFIRPERCVD